MPLWTATTTSDAVLMPTASAPATSATSVGRTGESQTDFLEEAALGDGLIGRPGNKRIHAAADEATHAELCNSMMTGVRLVQSRYKGCTVIASLFHVKRTFSRLVSELLQVACVSMVQRRESRAKLAVCVCACKKQSL